MKNKLFIMLLFSIVAFLARLANVFIVQSILSAIVVLLIPGEIILLLSNINFSDTTIRLCFAIGFSIVYTILFGVIINFSLPLVGIKNPLSFAFVFYGFYFSLAILFLIEYLVSRRRKDVSKT